MIYGHNGAPDPGAARGKNAFPKIINDPVCPAAAILKGAFSEIFLENKRAKKQDLRTKPIPQRPLGFGLLCLLSTKGTLF